MKLNHCEGPCWESQLDDYARRAATRKGTKRSVPWANFAATAGAALTVNSAAQAEIVHVTPPNPIRIELPNNPPSSTYVSTALDFDGDGNLDAFLGVGFVTTSTNSTTPGGGTSLLRVAARAAFASSYYNDARFLGSGSTIARLNTGESISAGRAQTSAGFGTFRFQLQVDSAILGGSTVTYGEFHANETGIAGVKFPSAGSDHFGWVRVLVGENDNSINALEIHEWAYEDVAGASIRAGEIPEPSTSGLGALALGAAGVAALRRRSAKA